MRGRTNINGSGNAVVNGELKEFVVADGEMVGKGDFVQASYKKRYKTNLFKNKFSKKSIDIGDGKCIILYRNGTDSSSITYASVFQFADNELIRKSIPVEIEYVVDFGPCEKIQDNIYAFTYYFSYNESSSTKKGYECCFLLVEEDEIVDIKKITWRDSFDWHSAANITIAKFKNSNIFCVFCNGKGDSGRGNVLGYVGEIANFDGKINIINIKNYEEELLGIYTTGKSYVFTQNEKEDEISISLLTYVPGKHDRVYKFVVSKPEYNITSNEINVGYTKTEDSRITPFVQNIDTGDVVLYDSSGKSSNIYNIDYINLGSGGKWIGSAVRISHNEYILGEIPTGGGIEVEFSHYDNITKTVSWSNKENIYELYDPEWVFNPFYGVVNVGNNNYLCLGGMGYVAVHYEDHTVSKGMTENLNTVKPYDGTNKAIGFAKTGGNAGETVKVYVPWEDN